MDKYALVYRARITEIMNGKLDVNPGSYVYGDLKGSDSQARGPDLTSCLLMFVQGESWPMIQIIDFSSAKISCLMALLPQNSTLEKVVGIFVERPLGLSAQ